MTELRPELEAVFPEADEVAYSGAANTAEAVGLQPLVQEAIRTTSVEAWPLVIAEGESAHWDYVEQMGLPIPEAYRDTFAAFDLIAFQLPPKRAVLQALRAEGPFSRIHSGETLFKLPQPVPSAGVPGMLLDEGLALIGLTPPFPATGRGVKVCVVDTGIDAAHPDLQGVVMAAKDFAHEGHVKDESGHGTHCAGIIAGRGVASQGRFRGVAPDARLLSAKVLDAGGSGRLEWILAGLKWAMEQQVDVVSMSLGASGLVTDGRSLLSLACQKLVDRGIIVCVAAGNSGPFAGTIAAPADAPGVITVGAVDKQRRLADFSSRGPTDDPDYTGLKPDVVAPGVAIISARSGNCDLPPSASHHYTSLSGTSMAAPFVAGAAALCLSFGANAPRNAGEMKSLLKSHAANLGYLPEEQGNGLMDLSFLKEDSKSKSTQPVRCGFCGTLVKEDLMAASVACAGLCGKILCGRCVREGLSLCRRCRWQVVPEGFYSTERLLRLERAFLEAMTRKIMTLSRVTDPRSGRQCRSRASWDFMLAPESVANVMRQLFERKYDLAGEKISSVGLPTNPVRVFSFHNKVFSGGDHRPWVQKTLDPLLKPEALGSHLKSGRSDNLISLWTTIFATTGQEGRGRDLFREKATEVAVVAASYVRLDPVLRDGGFARGPLGYDAVEWLVRHLPRSRGDDPYFYLVLFSPTGWEKEAKKAAAGLRGDSIQAILVETDEDGMWQLHGAEDGCKTFDPETPEEKVKRLYGKLDQRLHTTRQFCLEDAVSEYLSDWEKTLLPQLVEAIADRFREQGCRVPYMSSERKHLVHRHHE